MPNIPNIDQLWLMAAAGANPPAGQRKLFPALDGNWYDHDSAGVLLKLLTAADIGTLVEPFDATILKAADIGVTVEPFDADLISLAAAQGDLIYGSAVNVWSKLAKDTNATRYLKNGGVNNNPLWSLINLPDGVTGLLPAANLWDASTTTATGTIGELGISDLTKVLFFNNASPLTFGGFGFNGVNGQVVILKNIGSSVVYTINEDAAVTASHRFKNLITAINTPISAGGWAAYAYSTALSRWVLIAHEQGGSLSFSVSWTGAITNPAIGNGVLLENYKVIGNRLSIYIQINVGSTTTFGSGAWRWSLPANLSRLLVHGGYAYDASTGNRYAVIPSQALAAAIASSSQATAEFSSTVPFTWAVNDILVLSIEYE